MSRILLLISKILAVLLVLFLMIGWFFGAEPQIIMGSLYNRTPNFTYEQYMQSSLELNGDTILTRILTTIAYPGAKFGRFIHNTNIH